MLYSSKILGENTVRCAFCKNNIFSGKKRMRNRFSALSKAILRLVRSSGTPSCARHFSPMYLVPTCSKLRIPSQKLLDKAQFFRAASSCGVLVASLRQKSSYSFDLLAQKLPISRFYATESSSFGSESKNEEIDEKESDSSTKTDFDEEKEAEKRREKMKKNTKYGVYAMVAISTGAALSALFEYGSPPRDEQGNKIRDEYSDYALPAQYILRTWKELRYWDMFIKEPSREKLLPDPLRDPYYQPKYTLVIELTGVLVHPDWTYGTGWRFKKRPAVEYFLSQVGYPHFEVVIYTVESGMTAMPIIENLDPQMLIMYKLFRDTTKYDKGEHIKDLSKLNRDLSKVIFVDWDPKAFKLQPENALRIPKWEGDDKDTSLVDLAELLKMIMTSDVDDVRPIVQYYSKFDNPAKEFRDRSQRMAEQEKLSGQGDQTLTKSWSGKLFGYKRH